MAAMAHYEALLHKHEQVERKIRAAYLNYLPEEVIAPLKKQRLAIREEIENLQYGQNSEEKIEVSA